MSNPYLPDLPFQCCAHRGSRYEYAENTIVSFQKAIEAGATMIEMDVQLTADNKVVVFHDSTLERLGGSSHAVASQTWEELKKVDLHDFEARIEQRGRIPLFGEVLDTCGEDIYYYVELKYVQGCSWEYHQQLCIQAWQTVSEHNLLHKAMFVSFEASLIHYLQKVWKAGFLGVNLMRIEDLWQLALTNRPDEMVLCPEESLLQEEDLENLLARGFTIIPWVVDRRERMEWFMERGVAGVTTSEVSLLSDVMRRKGK